MGLYEVGLQLKPGLVDTAHSGSHQDMNFFTSQRSAAAVSSYLTQFFAASELTPEEPEFLLAVLRRIGIEAEAAMYEATRHVNTHKGLIFSLVLVLGAPSWVHAARFAPKGGRDFIQYVLEKVAVLGKLTLVDFELQQTEDTAGMRAPRDYGLTGIRDEVAAVIPSIQEVLGELFGKPDADLNSRALVEALFSIMSRLDDATLVRRGVIEALPEVKQSAQELLDSGALKQPSWQRAVHDLDERFVARRLSPGGAADCLFVTLFLLWISRAHGER